MGKGKRKHPYEEAAAVKLEGAISSAASSDQHATCKGSAAATHPTIKLEKVQTALPFACLKARMEQVANTIVPSPAPATSASAPHRAPDPATPKPTPSKSKRPHSFDAEHAGAMATAALSDTGSERIEADAAAGKPVRKSTDAKQTLNDFYGLMQRAPAELQEVWKDLKERRRSDVDRKEFVVSMSKVVGNSYDTDTLARWRNTTVASGGEAARGWRNYETVVKSDGQVITDERTRLKKAHTLLHPDLEADTTLEWPFYLQIWWSRDTQTLLIKTEDAVVRGSTVEATPEVVEALESQFASVQKAIYGNFASSSLPVAPAVRMQQSPARGTQLVPMQAQPAVADDTTKKRYEAARRSLSAAHGNWDRFKREVDADRPSLGQFGKYRWFEAVRIFHREVGQWERY